MAAIEHSVSGLPLPAPSEPEIQLLIMGGVITRSPTTPAARTEAPMMLTSAVSTGAKRAGRWTLERSDSFGLPSAKHRVTLPANTQMSKRPRPEFNQIWAVRGEGENDFAQNLHIPCKKLNFGEQSNDSKDLLED